MMGDWFSSERDNERVDTIGSTKHPCIYSRSVVRLQWEMLDETPSRAV